MIRFKVKLINKAQQREKLFIEQFSTLSSKLLTSIERRLSENIA